jgi:hypothetical protein
MVFSMHTKFIRNFAAFLFAVIGPSVAVASGGLLYRTDFETFTAGDDHWSGTEGWIGNSSGYGAHGIDQDVIPGGGLGKTAFIGFHQPASTLVFTAKPILYSPAAGDLPLVRVETLVGIQDSVVKTARDSFFVSIYNSSGGYLAGIRFDNRPATYGIWRADGVNPNHDTGVIFYRGAVHLLSFTINLPSNRWSADLDGIPLFNEAPFTATTRPVNFGYLAYEWQLSAAGVSGYGDNWMLVADTVVRTAPLGIEPFRASSFVRSGSTSTLTWPAQKGFDYQVEYSDSLKSWSPLLSGSSFPAVSADQIITFRDVTGPVGGRRFYRVLRNESP